MSSNSIPPSTKKGGLDSKQVSQLLHVEPITPIPRNNRRKLRNDLLKIHALKLKSLGFSEEMAAKKLLVRRHRVRMVHESINKEWLTEKELCRKKAMHKGS